MEEDSKTLKPYSFQGDKSKFTMWQSRFLSFAHYKGFKEIIQGKTKLIQKDAENYLTEEEITSNKSFHTLNNLAYTMLMMCVKEDVGFGAVDNARTPELPDGDAYKAWLNLETIFKPKSSAKKHELEQTFNKSSLDKEQKNPDEWFAELEKIRLQLKLDFETEITDDQMISQIIYVRKNR